MLEVSVYLSIKFRQKLSQNQARETGLVFVETQENQSIDEEIAERSLNDRCLQMRFKLIINSQTERDLCNYRKEKT